MNPTIWSIQRNINLVNAGITGIENSIQEYENRRTNLQTVKRNHEMGIGVFQRSYDKVSNNERLSSVKKTDKFEGEIADGLTKVVKNTFASISSVLGRGKTISTEIDRQVGKINTKIEELKIKKNNQSTHLTNLKTDLRNAKRRTW